MPKKIGELLIEKGATVETVVTQALEYQKLMGGRLGSILIELGACDEKAVVEALCEQKRAKPCKGSQLRNVDKKTLDVIPVKIATRYKVLPLDKESRRLSVAIADPGDLLALDELAFVTGCNIEPLLASERTILGGLEAFYGVKPKAGEVDSARIDGIRKTVNRLTGRDGSVPPPSFAEVAQAAQEAAQGSQPADAPPVESKPAGASAFWSDEEAAGEAAAPAAAAAAAAAPAAAAAAASPLTADGTSTEELIEDEVPRTLEEAARQLSRVEIRDEIADTIMWVTEDLFARSGLFIFQKNRTIGWTGQGNGLTPEMVRKVVMPIEDVSIFTLVRDNPKHYQGILPENPANATIVEQLGGERPPAVLVVPFGLKGRAIGCYYAEGTPEELAEVDLNLLFKLLQKAGLALEMLLLRTKIAMI